ncbi:Predicted amidohydrolase [Desulfocicer vacuolatum DSM 3385]|uniref:Predicted amidohydrolase n=1 Tax=Desulfocicer vacuolatum DSM 3385 TaxID=1121400 RepID=A0A1W1YUT7_9BACT|nr:carbon-nitrogen hydrolase family protein [Desulfocicer vacuolatum]SMC39488.1 Predicted amidohydrolase [Desulfocicer vacuolatum DSM 3385]
MEKQLKIGLVHLDVRYKNPELNRKTLLQLNEKAAQKGHQLIVNTEMAIPGYSFQSLEDIAPHVETDSGPTMTGLQAIAQKYGVFICLGFAEKDAESGIYYNSALVLDPGGNIVCRYHKINAETRWACPGNGVQDNFFETPWGRIGVLICSDTYHGLMPRQTALKGADLIIAPANWPRGGLDPAELWRVRALENGVYMVGCNRGGRDRTMSCKNAPSCAFDPHGRTLLNRESSSSALMTVNIPLEKGRLARTKRFERLKQRHPERYRPIYLDMRHVTYGGGDYTSYYDLAPPGLYEISCYTQVATLQSILNIVQKHQIPEKSNLGVLLFPELPHQKNVMALLPVIKQQIQDSKKAVCLGFRDEAGASRQIFMTPDGMVYHHGNNWTKECISKANALPGGDCYRTIVDMGPIRAGICTPDELTHPEVAVAHAKLGCDVLFSCAGHIEPSWQIVAAAKTLERINIAVAGHNMGFICQPPESHDRWKENLNTASGVCRAMLDSNETRSKKFQDRLDFMTLLCQT